MFKKLKQKSLQKQTEKNIRQRDISQINEPLKRLGFLVDESEFQDFEELYDFSAALGIQRKDVKVFSFLEYRKKLPTLQQNQIHNKDFSWNGEIHNLNAQEFLDEPLDVLIGFYKGSHEFLDLMVSASKAKFKVGVAKADPRLYDLIIEIQPQKVVEFREELKKYLQILNKI
ncbi:hypothetical protein ATE92_0011 [Ulvibacter sp. MAR_2010_11]|uniref:DUF6913 domain-containing protein n=1 Tax=Ulvibacter sp. MAR_2010_11 TaxID=1250229 RepID=UPI000C2B7F82|nr:hypothetical protein [Ulvibacter sp. MAR_2010_11]PKA81898.1 hypothetical protein ATE92_0011 [Ulvibacter sp. MAR_2010_11]